MLTVREYPAVGYLNQMRPRNGRTLDTYPRSFPGWAVDDVVVGTG
jgi:hypothetical protein